MGWSWANIDWDKTLTAAVGVATLVQAVVATVMMRSLRHSAENVRLANAAMKLSKDTAERQLRAYLDIAEVELQQSKGAAAIKVLITNTGQTPAYRIRSSLTPCFVAPANAETWQPPHEAAPENRGLLAAGGKATLLSRIPQNAWDEHVPALNARAMTLGTIVQIKYQDIYGVERRVRGRFVLMPDLHPSQLASCATDFDAD